MFHKILVPIDGGQLALSAIEAACKLAQQFTAQLFFVHIKPNFPVVIYSEGAVFDATTPEAFAESAEKEAQLYLTQAEQISRQYQRTATLLSETHHAPYQAIIDVAHSHGIDLIVMASHGRNDLVSLLLGSETQKVLSHSTVPVLVYRQPSEK